MDTNTLLRQHGYTPTTVENFGQVARRAAQLAQQPGATPETIMAQIEAEFGPREFVTLRDKPQPYTMYGTPGVHFDYGVVEQMNTVARLPVFVKGAVLPDAHKGYALSIGGVAALERAVSPYGVGVDIACRMCLTIFDGLSPAELQANRTGLFADLVAETRFGFDDFADQPRQHLIMADPLWADKSLPLHRHLAKARNQLGSSGGGNHFADLMRGKVLKAVDWLPLPDAGYGGTFINWLFETEVRPYHSWGNGSVMRVSPIGFAFDTIDRVLVEAERSAEVSHNHPKGIKGAQATALAVFLARQDEDKESIRQEISRRFGYNLARTIDKIRPAYRFDVSCQGSVPEAILAFLDSNSYEEAVRLAISLGGDSDTLACIAGGIAQAHYRTIPADVVKAVREILPAELLNIVDRFNEKYGW